MVEKNGTQGFTGYGDNRIYLSAEDHLTSPISQGNTRLNFQVNTKYKMRTSVLLRQEGTRQNTPDTSSSEDSVVSLPIDRGRVVSFHGNPEAHNPNMNLRNFIIMCAVLHIPKC